MYPLPQKITILDSTPNYLFVPEYKSISQNGNFGNDDIDELLNQFKVTTHVVNDAITFVKNSYKNDFMGNHQILIAKSRVGIFADEYSCLVINPAQNFIFTFDSDDHNFNSHFIRTIKEKKILSSIGRTELSVEQYKLLNITLLLV